MSEVLVIDDNPMHAKMAAKIASKVDGVHAHVFNDPFIAFDFALKKRPDFIITDMMMPKMDGITFIRELRKENVVTPVIIITAYRTEVTPKLLPSNNVHAVIQKPYRLDELREAISEVENSLMEKRHEDQQRVCC